MSCFEDLLSPIEGGRILDAACGSGRLARKLAELLTGFDSIVGIDPDKDSIDQARRDVDDHRISFRLADIMDLKPDPPRFETCSLGYALHHLPDPAEALARLADILVPGGHLIVNEPVSDGLSETQQLGRDVHHFKARVDRLGGAVHNETLTAGAIEQLVRSIGFENVRDCRETPPSPFDPDNWREETESFLDSYLDLMAGRPEYGDLQETRDQLCARMESTGIEPPAHLLIVAQKPVA